MDPEAWNSLGDDDSRVRFVCGYRSMELVGISGLYLIEESLGR